MSTFPISRQSVQQMVNEAPDKQYCSDKFPLHQEVTYRHWYHLSVPDQSETYYIEGYNDVLRDYLTRLRVRVAIFSVG